MAGLTCLPVDTANSVGISFTSDGGRKPDHEASLTWHELVASVPEDWVGFYLGYVCSSAGFIFIGKGASGSEVRVATSPLTSGNVIRQNFSYFPIAVAAGTRLAVAASTQNATTIPSLQIIGVKAADVPNALSFDYSDLGPIDFDSTGDNHTYGLIPAVATADNTKSAWTELSIFGTDSTPSNILNGDSLDYAYEFLGIRMNKQNVSNVDYKWLIDIAYGSAGNEVPFLENIYVPARGSNGVALLSYTSMMFKWGRPAGDRISVRYQVADILTMGAPRIQLIGVR